MPLGRTRNLKKNDGGQVKKADEIKSCTTIDPCWSTEEKEFDEFLEGSKDLNPKENKGCHGANITGGETNQLQTKGPRASKNHREGTGRGRWSQYSGGKLNTSFEKKNKMWDSRQQSYRGWGKN